MKQFALLLIFCITCVGHLSAETIAQVKDLYRGSDVLIDSGWQITGIVISDKDSANFDPKNISLQDSTGGIVVRFASNHNFALNDKVTVTIGGQTLTSFNGLIEVIYPALIDAAKIGTGTILPRMASISELIANSSLWQSTLVQIPCALISGPGLTYLGTKTLTDATGTMNIYTRSQATFGSANRPTDTVNLIGVLGNYNGPELEIRNTKEVYSGCIPYTPTPFVNHNIAELRALYNGSDVLVPANWQITGVVISDFAHLNTDERNMVLQDSTAGIMVRFTTAHSFAKGDMVTVLAGGRMLSSNAGWEELTQAETSAAWANGTGAITPRIAAISEIIANSHSWQSTLLQIPCALITGSSSTYSGTRTLTDATGSLDLYTRQFATFGQSVFPTDTVSLVGILGNFNGNYFAIRDEPDVTAGCIPHTPLNTGITEVKEFAATAETTYYDVLGQKITFEQCNVCIAITGNKARKIAIVK